MASGFGWGGGRSRCFADWQAFQMCYMGSPNPTVECQLPVNEYIECLHHIKETKHAKRVQDQHILNMKESQTGHKPGA